MPKHHDIAHIVMKRTAELTQIMSIVGNQSGFESWYCMALQSVLSSQKSVVNWLSTSTKEKHCGYEQVFVDVKVFFFK